ncbi:MAG: putative lipid II flippase FtsW [bacterium]|nr:putative lipid II flippase FtsW [bacterium]
MLLRKKEAQPDYFIIGLAALFVIFGLIMLASATPVYSFEKWGDSFYMIKHQILIGLLPGILLFFAGWMIPYGVWRKYSVLFFGLSALLLFLVLLPGVGQTLGGSRSWFVWKGFSFQPSELAKVGLIFYLAALFEKKGQDIKDFTYGFLPFIVALGVVLGLIILQPDMGTMILVASIAFLMYFFGGAAWKHFFLIGSAGLLALLAAVKAAPYRMARLTTFLHPETDPQGIGYHINQALIAIGSGGLVGLGFGQSGQKYRYLPEVSGDSIFAIAAEELGFLFCVIFIALLALFFYRIFKLSKNAPDDFSRYTAIGIGGWLATQTFFNISAMLGLLPLTGLPLPFISYGGTALAVSLFAVGVLANISKHTTN